jgi:hypothetical protein
MALTIKDNSKIAVMIEATEGTYQAPASGADFIGVLGDGLDVTPAKELLERSVLTGSIGKVTPRTGTRSVGGSIGVEWKAGSTTGAAPEYSPMLKAALGTDRASASTITTKSGTAEVQRVTFETKLNTADGDYIAFYDRSGTRWAAAADTTGGSVNTPTGAVWTAIAAGNKCEVDISGCTTAATVAAAFELAIDAMTGLSAVITTDDSAANGTMLFTQVVPGPVSDPVAYSATLDGASGTTWTTTVPGVGNTASVLQIDDADIANLQIGDCVVIKESGAYHVSPITARSTGTGTASVTLLVPRASSYFPNSVTIAAFKTYLTANTGHPSLSFSKYVESAVLEKAIGCRVTSMALEGFSTGALPSLKFGFDGMDFDRDVAAPSYTPSFDSSLPPVVLSAKVYLSGTAIDVNEFAVSLENAVGFATSTASANGRISGRVSSRSITGSINPYKQDNSVANYDKFVANTEFSLFAYAANPTGTTGEFNQVVAIYLPVCVISEIGEADQDGILQDSITFVASRGAAGATEEMYMGMS